MNPPRVFFNDLVGWMAEMKPSFRAQWLLWVSSCNNQLALVPPSSHCACCVAIPSCPGARTEQSLLGWGAGGYLAPCHLPLAAWPDWGQRGRLLCLRLMRTGLWSGYRVLQNRRPAGTSCPLCRTPPQSSVLALSELLIVLMNILEASRNGSSGLGVWFQGPWQLMIHSMTRESERETQRQSKTERLSMNCMFIFFVLIIISLC